MTLKDIIALLLERGNAVEFLWGFYITIAIGLIVFFGSATHSSRPTYLAGLVSIVFIAYAYVHCDGIAEITEQRILLYKLLDNFAATTCDSTSQITAKIAQDFKRVSKPPTIEGVIFLHVFWDIAVLLTIWILTLWPTRIRRSLR